MQLYVVQAIATDTYTYIQFIFIYRLTVGANIVRPKHARCGVTKSTCRPQVLLVYSAL